MSFEYCVAGLRVRTNRRASGLAEDGFFDGDTTVTFLRSGETADQRGSDSNWTRLADGNGPSAWFRRDGAEVVVEHADLGGGSSGANRALQLRRVVPFASALQGKVVLHGSAVGLGESLTAFVGPTGVGKSTLGRELSERGFDQFSDDLLPCRERGGRVVVPASPDDPKGREFLRMEGVFFLERKPGLSRPFTSTLEKRDCMAKLCWSGFGELSAPEAWAAQFPIYGQIAEQVPAFRLLMPDSRGLLDRSVDLVADELQRLLPKVTRRYAARSPRRRKP